MTATARRSWLSAAALAAAVLLGPAAAGAFGGEAEELVAKLRRKVERLRDLSVSFTQTTVFAVSGARQSAEGSLSLAKGNRYRIALEDRLIVSDGSTVWSWSPAAGQVVVDRYREDPSGITPERLLTRIPAEYAPLGLGEEKVRGRETRIVKMTPPASDRTVRWFKLWVDEDRLAVLRLQVLDIAGNEVTYDLREAAENAGLPDSTFRMTVPDGAEVLDLR